MTSENFRSITLRPPTSQAGSPQDRLAGAGRNFLGPMIIYSNQSVYTRLRIIGQAQGPAPTAMGARSPPPAGLQGKISSQLWKCEENEEEGRISCSVFGHRLQGVWPACALGGEWPVSSRHDKASCPLRTHHALLQ